MTIQQLEYVVAVYRQKHFAKAAEQCNVSQPTLSAMIQKLEDELGLKIFNRSQPVTPTPAGKLIVEQAWKALLRVRKIRETVEEAKQSLSGTFNIGILPTVAPYLLPRFFHQMMKKYPDTDMRVTEMKTEEIKTAIKRGELDVGIVAQLDGMEDFNITPLYYEKFFGYVAEGDALSGNDNIKTSDLTGEYLWMLDEGHCFRDQLQKFCHLKAARSSKRAYSLGSIETFMRMVESGKGVTFIPELATLQLADWQRKLVHNFAIPIPTREIVAITGKGFIRDTFLHTLIQEICTSVPKGMLTIGKAQQKV